MKLAVFVVGSCFCASLAGAQTCPTQLAAVQAAYATVQKDTQVYPTGLVSPNGSVTAAREKIVAQHVATLGQRVTALATCLSTPATPASLTVACPANVSTTIQTGSSAPLTFASPTTAGGTAPVTSSCTPASGSTFPLGPTAVTCSARDAAGQTASCTFSATVILAPPPSPPPAGGSPDGTHTPPASQIVDLQGHVWTLVPDTTHTYPRIYRDGTALGNWGRLIELCQGAIWIVGDDPDLRWFKWLGSDFDYAGFLTADPCPVAPAPVNTIVGAVPYALHVAWDAPFADVLSAGPIGYTAFLDGVVAASVLQSSSPCPSTGCVTQFPVQVVGNHTVAVTATRRAADGSLLQSAPAQLAFTLRTP